MNKVVDTRDEYVLPLSCITWVGHLVPDIMPMSYNSIKMKDATITWTSL